MNTIIQLIQETINNAEEQAKQRDFRCGNRNVNISKF